MLDNKRPTPILAVLGACALMLTSAPAFAQAPADSPAPAAAPASTPAPDAGLNNGGSEAAPTSIKHSGSLNPVRMFIDANPVVKVVMIGLILASVLSWTLLILKLLEFARLNGQSNKFVEAFRSARSIADINRISTSEEFEGNPLADMAAAASGEVELSRQAGLAVAGEAKSSTLTRANSAVSAVQSGLAKRLSGGMTFLASVGSSGPFIGLFGTVYGIMNSFIGIANTNTTNLAVVAPGIAEALLATGIGLFAAIPAVIFYNFFQVQISSFGTRTDGFIAELVNAISRQLDKGA
jgi:biopolymer transport protein ExbB